MEVEEQFSDTIKDLDARIELIGQHCFLKHSKFDPAENHPAVDYLCQKIGTDDEIEAELRIPICQECLEALLGDEWILFYCVKCNSSQWVCRKYAKYQYPFWLHVKWLDVCPICTDDKQPDDHH